jgi:drug/metabolite transporter (DMT)-like permease
MLKFFILNNKGNTVFWAIIACLLWSTAYAGIKLGLKYDTPFHFSGIRFIISGLVLLPFTVKPGVYMRMILENWKTIAWVTLLQIVVNYSLFYHGLNLVPGALGAVVYGAQPLIIAVVSSMMHDDDRLTRKKIMTILFGISGVILISIGRQALKLGTALELLGIAMIIIANIATGISNVIISTRSKNLNPLVLSSSSLFLGGIILYLVSIPAETANGGPKPLEYWLILSWLCFMASAAFSIWYKLLQRPGVKVSELNLWKFLTPVSGAILSWVFIPEEHPEWLTISGMIIITFSLIVYYYDTKEVSPVMNS